MEDVVRMLVGNKSDLEEKRAVSFEEGEALGISCHLFSKTIEIVIYGNIC